MIVASAKRRCPCFCCLLGFHSFAEVFYHWTHYNLIFEYLILRDVKQMYQWDKFWQNMHTRTLQRNKQTIGLHELLVVKIQLCFFFQMVPKSFLHQRYGICFRNDWWTYKKNILRVLTHFFHEISNFAYEHFNNLTTMTIAYDIKSVKIIKLSKEFDSSVFPQLTYATWFLISSTTFTVQWII